MPSNSYPQQIVKPRVPQQPSMRMERPIQPKASEQKYFLPGPQKVIRSPVHILKREVFSPPPRSAREKRTTSESPIKELANYKKYRQSLHHQQLQEIYQAPKKSH